jgi:hypothetical protein
MRRYQLIALSSTHAALYTLLSTTSILAADNANSQSQLLNTELPWPDSFLAQSMKPVIRRLKGQAVIRKDNTLAETKAPPAPNAVSTSPTPPAVTVTATAAPTAMPTSTSVPTVAIIAAPAGATLQTAIVSSPLSEQLNLLVAAAQQNNPEWLKYNEAVEHASDWKRRFGERTHDMINFCILIKGVSPSSEGGDIILGEKSKLKGLASAVYLRQKTSDEAELQLTSATIQLAGGLGNPDTAEGQAQISESMQEITKLAGKEAADKALSQLKQWQTADAGTTLPVVNKPLWTVAEVKTHIDEALAASLGNDAVMTDIKDAIHHFNHHSDNVMAAHRVARTALCLASLTPDFVGPAAQVVLFTYITITGGTEQEKILRELYIDKRLTSRVDLLGEQAHLAIYSYQLAALTQNSLLMNCSKQLLTRLCGTDTANRLLSPTGADRASGEKQAVSARP